jgi:DNA-binding transcriptional regulator YiaG
MSIAYVDSEATDSAAASTIFNPSPATKFAASALFVLATVSTTAGVPVAKPAAPIARTLSEVRETAEQTKPAAMSDAELVKWIKDESGLTWDQIARTFDVSRRAVHLWASGGRVSAGNAEALQAFAALVREAVGSTPTETRSRLLAVGSDGQSPIDRFRRAQFAASSSVTGTPLGPAALLGDEGPTDQ